MVTRRRFAGLALFGLPLECAFPEVRPRRVGTRAVREREGPSDRSVIAAVTPGGLSRGVRPGMDESEAMARCPELIVRDRDRDREVELLSRAAEALMVFGPEVELGASGCLMVEHGRSARAVARRMGRAHIEDADVAAALLELFDELGHDVAVVIASEPDTCRTLLQAPARFGRPGWECVDDSRERLARCPLDELFWADPGDVELRSRLREVCAELRLLGLQTVSDFVALGALPQRFSDVERILKDRALARRVRPLRPYVARTSLVEDFELQRGTENIEPLMFIVRRLVHRLVLRMEGRSRATTRLRLVLRYEPGLENTLSVDALRPASSKRDEVIELEFARPTRNERTILEVCCERLRVPGRVMNVRLEVVSSNVDTGAQLDLFSHFALQVEAASSLVSRLQAVLGSDAVFSPRLEDTHRPEAAWCCTAFDIEAALAQPAHARPPARPNMSLALPLAERLASRPSLPRIDELGSVIGGGGEESESEPPARWPKPVPRCAEDEPPPPCPPRPALLLQTPRILESSWDDECWSAGLREERFMTEWWAPQPLTRRYRTLETQSGRTLWGFLRTDASYLLHGIFD